jgi:hypothetical protein
MKTTHLIIGAAAIAAVGLFIYARKSKAPTAAVQPSPMTSSGGVTVTAAAKNVATRIASAFSSSSSPPAPADASADGDEMTARASDAQFEIAYSLA